MPVISEWAYYQNAPLKASKIVCLEIAEQEDYCLSFPPAFF